MSATNRTTNYDLPIYAGTDRPTYLGDWNSTMTKIDAGITGAKAAGDGAVVDASNAKTIAQAAETAAENAANSVSELAGKVTLNEANISSLTEKVTAVEGTVEFLSESSELSYTIDSNYLFGGTIKAYLSGAIVNIYGYVEPPEGISYLSVGAFNMEISGRYDGAVGNGSVIFSHDNTTGSTSAFPMISYDENSNRTKLNFNITGYNDILVLSDTKTTRGIRFEICATLYRATPTT